MPTRSWRQRLRAHARGSEVVPPSMVMHVPLTYEDESLAR
jgi:hypothetical protein